MYENCIGVIGSVQDFIWEIKLLNMGTDTEHQLFYRGQNDTSCLPIKHILMSFQKKEKSTFWQNLTNLGLARKLCFQRLITKQNI